MSRQAGMPAGPTERPRTFWNLSNHATAESWTTAQVEAAEAWGGGGPNRVVDFPFPPVDPHCDAESVLALAGLTLARLREAGAEPGEAVMVMGEFTLVCTLVPMLQAAGLVPVVATSHREASATIEPDGSVRQEHQFRFVRFRPYPKGCTGNLVDGGAPTLPA